jgi:hypothetical protein
VRGEKHDGEIMLSENLLGCFRAIHAGASGRRRVECGLGIADFGLRILEDGGRNQARRVPA